MKRAWIALVALAVVAALPASAAAKHGRPEVRSAAKYCKAQRAQVGAAAFRATYGGKGKKGIGKCVKQRVRSLNTLRRDAVQQCKTELGAPNPGQRDAFRKCVADKTQQSDDSNQQDFIGAVRSCLTEHDADPVAFNETYGANGSDREAFGHCVRQQFEQNQADGEGGDTGDNGDTGDSADNGDGGDQTEPGDAPDAPNND